MAVTQLGGPDGETMVEGHCDWCREALEPGKFQHFGKFYHVCFECIATLSGCLHSFKVTKVMPRKGRGGKKT